MIERLRRLLAAPELAEQLHRLTADAEPAAESAEVISTAGTAETIEADGGTKAQGTAA